MHPHSADKHLLVFSHHPLARLGLLQFIQKLQLGYHCESAASWLPLPQHMLQRPDTVLIIEFCGTQEEEQLMARRLLMLHEQNPQLALVVYTLCRDISHLADLQRRQVISLISPSGSPEQLRREMILALAGSNVCSTGNQQYTASENAMPGVNIGRLTACERKILAHVLTGASLTDIATVYHRSIKTVSAHKCNGMRKLGLNSDAELFQLPYAEIAFADNSTALY